MSLGRRWDRRYIKRWVQGEESDGCQKGIESYSLVAAAATAATPPPPNVAPATKAGRRHIPKPITIALAAMASPRQQHGEADGAAGSTGRFFPTDVLREILLRVPSAKTLCRLRAVCRSWRSLLSDAPFVADHAARHPGPLFAVSVVPGCYSTIPISNLYEVSDTPSQSPGAEIRFLDASGDVVKRVSVAPWCPFQIMAHGDQICLVESAHRVRLLDPATGATTLLPESEFPSMYLLGRTGGDGKMKLLSIATYGRFDFWHICKVLTLGGVWRHAPLPPTAVHTNRWQSAVDDSEDDEHDSWDDEYHGYNEDAGHVEDGRIAVFDLEREEWWPRLLPGPPAEFNHVWSSLVELNGRVVAVADKDYSVELWFLASSGANGEPVLWCKQCTIQVSRAEKGFLTLLPLWVLDEGRVAFWASKLGGHHVLRVYDPATETCTDVAATADCMVVGIRVYTVSWYEHHGRWGPVRPPLRFGGERRSHVF
ncbi:hypothetical protein EJB05_13530, partial [Eragrostis curvula]